MPLILEGEVEHRLVGPTAHTPVMTSVTVTATLDLASLADYAPPYPEIIRSSATARPDPEPALYESA